MLQLNQPGIVHETPTLPSEQIRTENCLGIFGVQRFDSRLEGSRPLSAEVMPQFASENLPVSPFQARYKLRPEKAIVFDELQPE